MQQKLQSDKNAAQHKVKKTEANGIPWTDIGTLSSWTETINFDPGNADLIPFQFVDDYGYTTDALCYAVKFTLAQDELIGATRDNPYTDFTLYADPDAQQEIAWDFYLLQSLKAGDYYLLISDGGNLQWSWIMPFETSIERRVFPLLIFCFSVSRI
jgi:hypothetical protein